MPARAGGLETSLKHIKVLTLLFRVAVVERVQQGNATYARGLRGLLYKTDSEVPPPPIMGELDGGRNASFIPFMLPHYWGLGGLLGFLYSLLGSPILGSPSKFEVCRMCLSAC